MSRLRPDRPHRKVRAASSVRPVPLSSLAPVVDPFRTRGGHLPDPDELPPACPACGGERLWFIDRRTTRAELICTACVPYQHTNEFPETDTPNVRAA